MLEPVKTSKEVAAESPDASSSGGGEEVRSPAQLVADQKLLDDLFRQIVRYNPTSTAT